MRTALAVLSLVFLACAVPPTAAAQCNDECIRLVTNDGVGYGCITSSTGMSCIATTTRCRLAECQETFLFSPGGQFAALINPCDLAQGDPTVDRKLAQLASSLAVFVPRARSAVRLART